MFHGSTYRTKEPYAAKVHCKSNPTTVASLGPPRDVYWLPTYKFSSSSFQVVVVMVVVDGGVVVALNDSGFVPDRAASVSARIVVTIVIRPMK